jgi:acyl-CoA thioester hydrolase
MTGGVVAMGERDADLALVLHHSGDGRPAASFRTRVVHTTRDGRPFPWPARSLQAAEALRVEPPEVARPRSIAADGPFHPDASLDRAVALGMTRIARGVAPASACDAFRRLEPAEFVGRVSDGIGTLLAGVRRLVQETAPDRPPRVGGAVLEYRLDYLEAPYAGDHLEVRSGLAEVTERYQRIAHWLLDPVTGRPWAVSEAVAINFDLDRRKVVPISAAAREVLSARIIPALAPVRA